MKKIAVILLFVCGTLSAQNTGEERAFIREFSGTVELRAPGAAGWTAAIVGQRIETATAISTGFNSTALISLGNSLLTVRPLTRLTLQEIQELAGNEQVGLYLQTGRVRADVSPPAGGRTDFTVRSPTVTASVRGTSFEFDGLSLRVTEGRVHVRRNEGIAVYVGAGHKVTMDTETGKIANPAERAREVLALPAQAGKESVPDAPAIPAAAAAGDFAVGTDWN
ncbi:FecR family protein [Treponema primitia]|uniref:FecR family protein n=1 Tax=Treponema primitia TaxID=88058 RepID=UPI0002554D3A|nr:FecR domain-containing protein [Treponema primitia]